MQAQARQYRSPDELMYKIDVHHLPDICLHHDEGINDDCWLFGLLFLLLQMQHVTVGCSTGNESLLHAQQQELLRLGQGLLQSTTGRDLHAHNHTQCHTPHINTGTLTTT
jgi:hypothetical protein